VGIAFLRIMDSLSPIFDAGKTLLFHYKAPTTDDKIYGLSPSTAGRGEGKKEGNFPAKVNSHHLPKNRTSRDIY